MNGVTQPKRFLDRRAAALAGLCAVVAVACYVNALGNGFCEDDNPIIALNPLVTEPGQWGVLWLKDYWHRDAGVEIRRDLLYRPVAILTYRLNHAVHGLRPFGYHLVNLLLHVAVTLLVYRLGLRMTGSRACAALAGCAFAVLPIHVEAVTHVVGRAELCEHVWDENHDPFSNAIEVYINRLRKKIDEEFDPPLIHTRRGLGYELDAE